MSIGIGGATGFHMASNHQTAANHAFREEVKYDPAKQTRVKCTSCGCWANRGENCPQCKRPTAAVVQRRNNNVKVEPLPNQRRSSSSATGTAAAAASASSSSAPKKKVKEDANAAPQAEAPAPETPTRRVSTTTATTTASPPATATATAASSSASSPPSSLQPAKTDDVHNALRHKFRDEVKFDPAKQTKIKCSKCGCWAYKGVPCKLCKNVTNK